MRIRHQAHRPSKTLAPLLISIDNGSGCGIATSIFWTEASTRSNGSWRERSSCDVTVEVSHVDDPERCWVHAIRCLVITDDKDLKHRVVRHGILPGFSRRRLPGASGSDLGSRSICSSAISSKAATASLALLYWCACQKSRTRWASWRGNVTPCARDRHRMAETLRSQGEAGAPGAGPQPQAKAGE